MENYERVASELTNQVWGYGANLLAETLSARPYNTVGTARNLGIMDGRMWGRVSLAPTAKVR